MIPDRERFRLNQVLDIALNQAYMTGKRFFLSGGALGFDTLAAEAVLRLREKQASIKLILVLPCLDQSRRWSLRDQTTYQHMLAQADQTIYTSREYFEGCMQKRNRFLVDHASCCICYLRSCRGGTWNTVSYADDQGLSIRNLAQELR